MTLKARPARPGLSNPGYWDRKKGGSAWGVARSVVNVPPIGGACTTPDLARYKLFAGEYLHRFTKEREDD